jgi:hypothetical protein
LNGKKAKALRKRIYGEQSIKQREYGFFTTVKKKFLGMADDGKTAQYQNVNKTTIVCKGLRRAYQDAKRRVAMIYGNQAKKEIEKDLVPYTPQDKEDAESQCGAGEVGGLPPDYWKGYRNGYRDGIADAMAVLIKDAKGGKP